jgi:hypothetical protein
VLEAKQGVSGGDRDCKLQTEECKLQIGEGQAAGGRRRSGHGRRGTGAWDDALLRARGQEEQYVRAIAEAEEWRPFLIVVDVGHSFELYAEFSRSGKT